MPVLVSVVAGHGTVVLNITSRLVPVDWTGIVMLHRARMTTTSSCYSHVTIRTPFLTIPPLLLMNRDSGVCSLISTKSHSIRASIRLRTSRYSVICWLTMVWLRKPKSSFMPVVSCRRYVINMRRSATYEPRIMLDSSIWA